MANESQLEILEVEGAAPPRAGSNPETTDQTRTSVARTFGGARKDLSRITGHNAIKCLEPRRNRDASEN